MKPVLRAALVASSGLILSASGAVAESGGGMLDQFSRSGETVECIDGLSGDQATVLNDSQILFRAGGGVYYLNELVGRCTNLTNVFYHYQRRAHDTRLCRNDRLTVVESSTRIPSGFCRFGAFELLERKSADDRSL